MWPGFDRDILIQMFQFSLTRLDLKTLENGMHVSNRVSSLLCLLKNFERQFIDWLVIRKPNCNSQLHVLETIRYWLGGWHVCPSHELGWKNYQKYEVWMLHHWTSSSCEFEIWTVSYYVLNFVSIISKLVLRANALLLMSFTLLILVHVIGCRKEF